MPALPDKRVLGAALVAAGGFVFWFGAGASAGSGEENLLTEPPAFFEAYPPAELPAPASATGRWEVPPSQTRGVDWVYDVFTPPEIHYDASARRFSVVPRVGLSHAKPLTPDDAGRSFGLRLIDVRHVPFRLQLVGYAGAEENRLGVFENVSTGETVLGGTGFRIDALGIAIEEIAVQRLPVAMTDSMAMGRLAAMAIVRDTSKNQTFTLSDQEQCLTSDVLAMIELGDGGEPAVEVREGDALRRGEVTYRIGTIRLAPPSLEVTKDFADRLEPEFRTLVAAPATGAEPPPDILRLP